MIYVVKYFGKIKEYTTGIALVTIALWILSIFMQRVALSLYCA